MKKSWLPNIFTFINLGCGILSLLATFDKKFLLSALLIIAGAIVDRYDGRIARYFNASSELGKELDSLADLVSFGVAPSILVFVLYNFKDFGPYGILGYAVLLLFPICGAFRLARYNTAQFDGDFRGVPITIVGVFMAIYALFTANDFLNIYVPFILMIIGAYLMVSNIKIKKL
ncbi:CDP-diacylglycerol--serine O-phosphatidyltransferase [uncultured Clostridium sp.]|uniref:CDP-diacylglycerol--serine O-phosphatidyltransferase n=1 Tax=uncultured Clostridium sp. TaxID=59620 RepID=UPI002623E4D4|nr:CDP-diacylglycerol--serine O-phosphatidyltransferase [uncultured Clostridium sp.]